MTRSCGILLPISALPSEYGIGTLGSEARCFAEFLHAAGQRYWQILPIGPTGCGDSPYQSFSTFAGNPYFVDLEELARDGLLTKQELEAEIWGTDRRKIDYSSMYDHRLNVLRVAHSRSAEYERGARTRFETDSAAWLEDYALYMALKRELKMAAWTEWPQELRERDPGALENARERLAETVSFFKFLQFLFFKQWDELKAYAAKLGIGIIGDLPIYVALDSSDVWANPQYFMLDECGIPLKIAGVPPDYFNSDGQLWGNPLYDWARLKADGYGWWIRRFDGAAKLYDVVRFDHFRGLESFWAVPYGDETAKRGEWVKGPGLEFVGMLTSWFSSTQIIAEDLGILTPQVCELLSASGLPGMKVLEFAFDTSSLSSYLPHNYGENCVCYVGTHDNATLEEWRESEKKANVEFAKEYLGLNDEDGFNWGFIRGGMGSAAGLFIAQMQDYLALGASSRMNVPGTAYGNWQWRMLKGEASASLAKKIRERARIYGRLPAMAE
ncbi:MAG: 4-alpha-glucanotransferase [Oscillospiraceae bacterium]